VYGNQDSIEIRRRVALAHGSAGADDLSFPGIHEQIVAEQSQLICLFAFIITGQGAAADFRGIHPPQLVPIHAGDLVVFLEKGVFVGSSSR